MRILMVSVRYPPYTGGIETHTYEVAWRLAAAGVHVTVLTTDTTGTLAPAETRDDVHIIRVPAWPRTRDYFFAPAIGRVIRQRTWDLVHCQGINNFVPPLAMLTAQRAAIPYIVSLHSGGDVTPFRRLIRAAHWRALRPLVHRAHQLIAVSPFEVAHFGHYFGLPPDRFSVIPNGADHILAQAAQIGEMPELAPVQPSRRGEPSSGPLIVSIGRLVPYKGHQRAITALPKVLEAFPDAHLRIIGSGPYEKHLRRLVARLGLGDHVEIGPIPPNDTAAMRTVLQSCSLVTALSDFEGQGLVALEAIACGRPLLVNYATALKEFSDQGHARVVAPDDGPAAVAAAMKAQLRNPLIPVAVRVPTWDACVADLLAVYKRTLQQVTAHALVTAEHRQERA